MNYMATFNFVGDDLMNISRSDISPNMLLAKFIFINITYKPTYFQHNSEYE